MSPIDPNWLDLIAGARRAPLLRRRRRARLPRQLDERLGRLGRRGRIRSGRARPARPRLRDLDHRVRLLDVAARRGRAGARVRGRAGGPGRAGLLVCRRGSGAGPARLRRLPRRPAPLPLRPPRRRRPSEAARARPRRRRPGAGRGDRGDAAAAGPAGAQARQPHHRRRRLHRHEPRATACCPRAGTSSSSTTSRARASSRTCAGCASRHGEAASASSIADVARPARAARGGRRARRRVPLRRPGGGDHEPRRSRSTTSPSTRAARSTCWRRCAALDEPPFLLFTSTNKVYGDLRRRRAASGTASATAPVDAALRERGIGEARPLDFHSPYGCSKGAADQYVLDYARSYGLPTVVFRMSCIYGPHQFGNEDQGWVAHFLLRALERRADHDLRRRQAGARHPVRRRPRRRLAAAPRRQRRRARRPGVQHRRRPRQRRSACSSCSTCIEALHGRAPARARSTSGAPATSATTSPTRRAFQRGDRLAAAGRRRPKASRGCTRWLRRRRRPSRARCRRRHRMRSAVAATAHGMATPQDPRRVATRRAGSSARGAARAGRRRGAAAAGGLAASAPRACPLWEGRPWFDYPQSRPARRATKAGAASSRSARRHGLATATASLRSPIARYAEYDVAAADASCRCRPRSTGCRFPGEPLGCAVNIFRAQRHRRRADGRDRRHRLPRRAADAAGVARRRARHRDLAAPFALDVARAAAQPRRS